MNTIADIIAFNREHASRHIGKSSRGWWGLGVVIAVCFVLSVIYLAVSSPHTPAQRLNHLAATPNTR